MASLEEFAKEEKTKSNRVAWRDRTEANQQLWKEAIAGINKGYSVTTVARWLIKENNCPLSIHTLRHQLKDTQDVYS